MSETASIETKDFRTIVALITLGHVPTKIEAVDSESGRSKVIVYHFGKDAISDYEAWMRGVCDEPFGTIRRVQEAESQFKNNLHRYMRR